MADDPDNVRMVKIRLEEGNDDSIVTQPLPPINKIKIPHTQTKSATIRWLSNLGYEVKDISAQLGIRYQQVRNIVTTIPKRAAREDSPEFVVEYLPDPDGIELALDAALEQSLLDQRKDRRTALKEEHQQQGLED